ncbi:MAG: Ig-like domain-containing protein [bacterium]
MRRLLPYLFTVFFFLSALFYRVGAEDPSTDPVDYNPPVSATVPSQTSETIPGDTTPPTSPILLRPTDGTATGDSTPEFVWRQSTDLNSNTIHYTFYLDNVATFLGVSNDGSSSGTGYTATIDGTEVRLIPTTALSDGTYTWKVVASDPAGNQASSTSWSLTIDTVAPFLTLTKLDNLNNPPITEESSFEIAGPKAVSFVVLTEPYASVRLSLTQNLEDSEPITLTSSTNHTGEATFAPHLATGLYSVSISATDHVNLVSVLPTFTLNITASQIILPGLPPLPVPPLVSSLPSTIYNLPVTISHVTSIPIPYLTLLFVVLLALLLLFLFLRRSPNLILLDTQGNPINNALITHSLPRSRSHPSPLYYSTLHTTFYRSYIPHLSRFSTLTIRLQEPTVCTVTVLSLSVKRPSYTIIL